MAQQLLAGGTAPAGIVGRACIHPSCEKGYVHSRVATDDIYDIVCSGYWSICRPAPAATALEYESTEPWTLGLCKVPTQVDVSLDPAP